MRLHEWLDSNGKKVSMNSSGAASTPVSTTSGGYKKRFEKLIRYHIDHASPELESVTKKDITDYGFQLGEHYNTGLSEFDRTIIVSVNKYTDEFFLSIFVDGKVVYRNNYEDYKNFIKAIEPYIYLPDSGTQAYDDLLTEWLDASGKKVSTSSTTSPQSAGTSNYPSQEENYKKLLAQIDSDKLFRKYTVKFINNRLLELSLGNGVEVDIIYKPYVPCYHVNVAGQDTTCNSWKEVLKHLIIEGIIGDTDLCESASSIVEDFRAYENLWN